MCTQNENINDFSSIGSAGNNRLKIKICGMKYLENIQDVAALKPDYLGFIFYEKSKRNFEAKMPVISNRIKKTGVFVNASIEFVREKVKQFGLYAVQLHGDESPEYCKALSKDQIEIIKVFSIGDALPFEEIKKYEAVCDYYLFDTKGKERGGNGQVFNWTLLKDYPFKKPYFLSGGIGLDEVNALKSLMDTDVLKHCFAIDVNSRFEIAPGLKNVVKLKEFIHDLELD